MRSLVLSGILACAAFVAGCGADTIQGPLSARPPLLDRGAGGPATAFEFTAIDVPNAGFTAASGINARGDIVGSYRDAAGRTLGYLLRGGEFTTIDVTGSAGTEARGISPDGEIVGNYLLSGVLHGFRRTPDGAFVTQDYPGHTNTIIQRMLPDGTMLGCRHDGDTMGTMKGVTFTGEGSAEIEYFASMLNGATPDGRRMVGLYTNMMAANRTEGFLIDDGEFTPLVVAGSTQTAAWDVNPAGDVVGVYTKAGVHGFLLRGDVYVAIDFPAPGVRATRATGINARGDVVGTYVAADGTSHGFVASQTRGGGD
jgi:uncharacterized membrane protein